MAAAVRGVKGDHKGPLMMGLPRSLV